MVISPEDEQVLRTKLPIDHDEKILGVFKHHWFIYFSSWAVGIAIAIVILVIAVIMVKLDPSLQTDNRPAGVIGGAAIIAVLVLIGASIPAHLRSQERLVLTNEALLQIIRPTIFASRVDQVGLERMDNVSARQGFLGTILGFGHMTVETPGEQDNYEFRVIASPQEVARQITSQHEIFVNSEEQRQAYGTTGGQQPVQIDPVEYQKFLQFQQMEGGQNPSAASPPQPVSPAPFTPKNPPA